MLQSTPRRPQDEGQLQRLVQLPGHHVPRVPVQDRYQVHPARLQPDVRDIHTPDMVGVVGRDMPEQVGIGPLGQGPFARVGTRADAGDAHLPHVPLHALPRDQQALPA